MFNLNIPFLGSNRQFNNRQFNNNGMPRRPMGVRASGALVLVIGLVFVAFGGYMVYDGEQTKDWPTTTGTVQGVSSKVDYDSDGNSETKYSYTLEYTIKEKPYTARETSSSYVRNGDQKQLAYNPDTPTDVRVRSGNPGWLTWIFPAIGAILAIVGLGMVIKGGGGSTPGIAMSTNPAAVSPLSQPTPMAQPPVVAQPPAPVNDPSQNGPLPPTIPPIG